MAEGAWYRDGLRFACTQCGHCCTGAPGWTWVSEGEIAALARRLKLDEAAFRRKYTRAVRGRGVSLTEKGDHECVFWQKGAGCTVYEDRPKQCRTWPFWRQNVATQADWDEAGEGCPGIDRGAKRSAEEIAAIAADDGLPG